MEFSVRAARKDDAAAITEIYNQGIADRIATFETEPRSVVDIAPWFDHARAFVVVVHSSGKVAGYAVAHPYTDRCCYRGVGEFSVYVRGEYRRQGVGVLAMKALIEAAREAGLWKLTSRIFPENKPSLTLVARTGFNVIGTHEKHGKLDGIWKDCVIVERLIPENID